MKRNTFEDVFRYIDMDPVPPSTCWLWRGDVSSNGIPYFQVGGRKWIAYRLTYWLTHPNWDILNQREKIRHQCKDMHGRDVDNPLCCNPDHALPGTHEENMLDMMLKGRSGLTKECIRDILRIQEQFPDLTQKQIAARVGHTHGIAISRQTVSDLLRGARHKQLKDALDEEERKLMNGGRDGE